jgi:hypothetical protein
MLILILPAASYGQLGGLLKKGASKVFHTVGNEASNEANRQADSIAQQKAQNAQNSVNNSVSNQTQNVQNSVNNTVNNQTQNVNQRRGALNLGSVLGGADIKHNDEYSFDGRMYMQMETYNKKEPLLADYYIYFNKVSPNTGIEFSTVTNQGDKSTPVSTVMVTDIENRCFMMLLNNDNQKTGIISALPSDSVLKARAAQKPATGTATGTGTTPSNIVKTGNSKVIAGYKCDEYKITEQGKQEYSLVWMTKDLKITADKSYWTKAGIPSYSGYPGFEQSSILAMESYDENNKLAMKMETKEINPNFPHTISATGYTFIKMNFNQMNPTPPKK